MNKTNEFHNRREFLKGSAAAAIGLGCLGNALRAVAMSRPPTDAPATHNMLVVGEQTVYLSHLPMFDGLNKQKTDFRSPHRYQVILEATFTDGSRNLTEDYTADRKKNPAVKMYTFNPALFVLPDLDPAGSAPVRKFRGNAVFRGHLERGGKVFIGNENAPSNGLFDVNVLNVVHFHKFVPGAVKPTQLQYILFGKGEETFLAHLITAPPDFDQIISVRVSGQQFTDADLSRGIKVTLTGKAKSSTGRIREKQQASGTFAISGGDNPKPLKVEALREFYFEEGELFVPPNFDPTKEEKKSGFGE
jgi:hypothetical protein